MQQSAKDEKDWTILARSVGSEVKQLRKLAGMTGRALAEKAKVSVGTLSKIENGSSAPSFATLMRLSEALEVPVARFFVDFEQRSDCSIVRAGQGLVVERQASRAGQRYELLGHVLTGDLLVEPYLVSLNEDSTETPTFQHSGLEFVYLLEGELTYRYGERLINLKEGDSLLFDCGTVHGPETMIKHPVRYISAVFSHKE